MVPAIVPTEPIGCWTGLALLRLRPFSRRSPRLRRIRWRGNYQSTLHHSSYGQLILMLSTPKRVFWSQPAEGKYLVMAVEPFRLNERLSIRLFLYANHALFPFHNSLAGLLLNAKSPKRVISQWLHKILVAPEVRAAVLRSLDQVNIHSRTLFLGQDGFCRSLEVSVQIEERDGWPGVQVTKDRETWVKGTGPVS